MSFQETLVSKKQKKTKQTPKMHKTQNLKKKKTKKRRKMPKTQNLQKKTKIATFSIFITVTTTLRD